MKLFFRIKVVIPMEAIVEVDHTVKTVDAELLAHRCAISKLAASGLHPDLAKKAVVVGSFLETFSGMTEGRNAENYTCSACGEISPKYDFGPGWVTCPVCGGRPEPITAP